ncbi:Acyl-CoA synthetase (AMP-forming)/AMP-acid ligase II [Agromyces cerinus subsp. cerinus]|uniref:Acyl-CoA synthetase (AMP-forming)/AMP-acid ligase II n=1 Tax=Agromyces cerinus subsp. cerinus TaxID=232089 RepID=A0A1N6DK23_9MICO|nr:Acyl-CoA synthetase (AMP-forming)/AMP-acid ligase II [Agromyces cerinus subsp. cerinus]
MSDWLRGPRGGLALAFGGDAVRYGELADAVAAAVLPSGDGLVACPVGTDPVRLITLVLACLERGRPVLVGGDAADAERISAALPLGTELALLTSGSSDPAGVRRAVARTNASWLASAAPLAEVAGIRANDRIAVTGPLHVSMHLYAALHALWSGAAVGDELSGASTLHATPTRLARLLEGDTLPAAAVVAGAAMSDALRERAAARGIRVTEYYGAAELSFVAVGRGGSLAPFPGVEVELRPTAAGRELWARSPYLALGVVGGGMLRRDDDGFATVGDLAEPVGPEMFRIIGRGDAAITTAGATVLAEDIEARLLALPGVVAAVVLGEADELLGERVVAVVELDETTDATAVIAAARARLSTAELPRRWFVSAIPTTMSGKPARGLLRVALAAGTLGPAIPSTSERSGA